MIKLRHEIFITLVVTLCLVVTAQARFHPPKSILRGGSSEVLQILLRGNPTSILRGGNPVIATELRDNTKPLLRIGNPVVALLRDNPKPVLFAGIPEVLPKLRGNPKPVFHIENPTVASMLRNKPRAIFGNPEILAMLRENSKPILLEAIPKTSAMPRDNPTPILLAGIPEVSVKLRDNSKHTSSLHSGNLKLLAMLREYPKPKLPAMLRVREHSESDNNVFKKSGVNKYIIKDNDLKETFNKIIETVTKVNDERLESLKKFFELENYLPQVLRTMEQKEPLIAIVMNTSNYKSINDNLYINDLTKDPQYANVNKKHNEPSNILKAIIEGSYFNDIEDDNEMNISQESDKTQFTKNYYLRGWKGCNKSASKACQKACNKAIKDICSDYMCSSKLKSAGKKQCKKRCNKEFSQSG